MLRRFRGSTGVPAAVSHSPSTLQLGPKSIHAVARLQAVARGLRARTLLRMLQESWRAQNMCAEELLISERSYLIRLIQLQERYALPLGSAPSYLLPAEHHMVLFRFLSALIDLHTELRDALIVACSGPSDGTAAAPAPAPPPPPPPPPPKVNNAEEGWSEGDEDEEEQEEGATPPAEAAKSAGVSSTRGGSGGGGEDRVFVSALLDRFMPKLRALYVCYAQDWARLADHRLRVLESDARGAAFIAGARVRQCVGRCMGWCAC